MGKLFADAAAAWWWVCTCPLRRLLADALHEALVAERRHQLAASLLCVEAADEVLEPVGPGPGDV